MTGTITPPFYPIIYVRGYAGSQTDVEDTTSDPYMGFNIGATKIRQLWDGKCVRYYFESPLIRLMKDYKYSDVYEGGAEATFPPGVDPRSVFILRYYDQTSLELGNGKRDSIQEAAGELAKLILSVRERVCGTDAAELAKFKVYLVAHSMGGLVCRSLLQNHNLGAGDPTAAQEAADARVLVDKFFTYATPHNGIDMSIVGNLPSFFSINDTANFNRGNMRNYLDLPDDGTDDVSNLNGKFDPDRAFNLVGTNDRDYAVAYGWSRKLVGPMSDGLVRIVNATTWGEATDAAGKSVTRNSPRAFVYRSHSGYYGIVNSEEGYQNMVRFLFGTVRIDGVLKVESLTLPPAVEAAHAAGKAIRASYQFEVVVRVRGKLWDLHRRTVAENSAIFRAFDDMFPKPDAAGATAEPRHPFLFSTFLSGLPAAKVDPADPSLGFSVDLGVLVPQYEINKLLIFTDHYEGGYLFRDKINFRALKDANGEWQLEYGFDSATPNMTSDTAQKTVDANGLPEFQIPIEQLTTPGIKAMLILKASAWNTR